MRSQAGISQPINSAVIDEIVPAAVTAIRNGHWAGISMRARVIYASKDRVKQETITYEELADQKWKGKICIRSGQHIYNNALFAAYVAKHGEAKAEEWLRGLKANLAQKPSGGDRETARDVAAGKCDLGIGNTYYWALMQKDPDKKAWADATRVVLPTFEGGGTHVNLSGVLLTKNAPNKANGGETDRMARSARRRSRIYADANYEYPIRPGVRAEPGDRRLRQAEAADSAADRPDRRQPQGGRNAGRQGRVRQLNAITRDTAGRLFPHPLEGEGGSNERSEFETGEAGRPRSDEAKDPSPVLMVRDGAARSPHHGRGKQAARQCRLDPRESRRGSSRIERIALGIALLTALDRRRARDQPGR